MSIDVYYYSFSPSRADEQWSNFIEDLSVLRKKHATWDKHLNDSKEFEIKINEIKARFKPAIDQIIKKIFDHFDAKGYIIPWVEWNEELGKDNVDNLITRSIEDKMSYLISFGCVYLRTSKNDSGKKPYLMLRTDASELEEMYIEKIKEQEDAIEEFTKSFAVTPMKDKNIVLNQRQELLDTGAAVDYLKYENSFDQDQLISDLKYLDIYYGSVRDDYFENPKLEFDFLENIIKAFNLKIEEGLPTKEEWIKLFQNINSENIQKLDEYFAKKYGWSEGDAEGAIRDYLRSVRPVAKDLKETPDAFFIRVYGGGDDVEPKSAELLLLERAKKHAEKYKGLLKPVL